MLIEVWLSFRGSFDAILGLAESCRVAGLGLSKRLPTPPTLNPKGLGRVCGFRPSGFRVSDQGLPVRASGL